MSSDEALRLNTCSRITMKKKLVYVKFGAIIFVIMNYAHYVT